MYLFVTNRTINAVIIKNKSVSAYILFQQRQDVFDNESVNQRANILGKTSAYVLSSFYVLYIGREDFSCRISNC